MRGLNKVMLIGRLGRDPELRYTAGGQPYVRFSVATDDSWTDRNGERQTRTEWHNIVGWRKLAEICNQYLSKGRLVYIEGRLQTRQWEDQSGNKRYSTEIVMNDMQMLESRTAAGEPSGSHPEPPYESTPGDSYNEDIQVSDEPITDEDVPF
ncbi:MAG: single-stranded DNA-binding protein [Acidobacteria bacterium]|nr:single-stranded DNA-binding protein [Acidobacteriota bacterium]